jgi:SAM-dependent methyltransferase
MDETVIMSYSSCDDCHFIFQSEYLGDEFIAEYYRLSPMLRRDFISDIENVQHREQAQFVSQEKDLTGCSVLEIGADTGNFLMHLHYSYNCKAYYSELSEEAREILAERKELSDEGILRAEEKFDVIVMRHVLEHVQDLASFLPSLKHKLSNDGYLFIEVPDWSFLDEDTDPLIFEHCNQFNSFNLSLLLQKSGFSVTRLETRQDPRFRSTPKRVIRVLAKQSNAVLSNTDFASSFQSYFREHFLVGFREIDRVLEAASNSVRVGLAPASNLALQALSQTKVKSARWLGFFDIDPKKHGRKIEGVPIYPSQHLIEYGLDIVFVLSMGAFGHEIERFLRTQDQSISIHTWDKLTARRTDCGN